MFKEWRTSQEPSYDAVEMHIQDQNSSPKQKYGSRRSSEDSARVRQTGTNMSPTHGMDASTEGRPAYKSDGGVTDEPDQIPMNYREALTVQAFNQMERLK